MRRRVVIALRRGKQQVRDVDDEAAVDAIVAGGAARGKDGMTKVRLVRVLERWEPADLAGREWVEIERPLEGAAPRIANELAALRGRWSCAHCDRVELEQVADLELELADDADVLFGTRGELFVRAGLAGDAPARPTVGGGHVQLVVPPGARLDASRPPLSPRGDRCPGCGRDAIDRTEDLRGSWAEAEQGELWVARARPLPVTAVSGGPVVASDEPLGWRGLHTAEPRHTVGEPVDLAAVDVWRGPGAPALLARAAWVRALLERGATGLDFRPVDLT